MDPAVALTFLISWFAFLVRHFRLFGSKNKNLTLLWGELSCKMGEDCETESKQAKDKDTRDREKRARQRKGGKHNDHLERQRGQVGC